jgi:arylformamidase
MSLYDITVPLSPTLPVYPGDPAIDVTPIAQLAAGDSANVSRVVLSSHSGTHIDAPRHFFAHGRTVDSLDIQILMGPVQVYELQQTHHITAEDLQRLPVPESPRVVFKTPNSRLWVHAGFQPDYVALTASAAEFLLDHNVQLVGIDYLSVDAFTRQDFPVHRALLAAGVVILEGLDLRQVPPGPYELIVLPLLLQDGDGAPARAILRSSIPSPL